MKPQLCGSCFSSPLNYPPVDAECSFIALLFLIVFVHVPLLIVFPPFSWLSSPFSFDFPSLFNLFVRILSFSPISPPFAFLAFFSIFPPCSCLFPKCLSASPTCFCGFYYLLMFFLFSRDLGESIPYRHAFPGKSFKMPTLDCTRFPIFRLPPDPLNSLRPQKRLCLAYRLAFVT